jgi:microcompartment protein CcmL/EutN
MASLSLGIVDVIGLTAAIAAADAMVKAANVRLAGYEITNGFGLVTVRVRGDVGAVQAAVAAGVAAATKIGVVQGSLIIARPAAGLDIFTNDGPMRPLVQFKASPAAAPAAAIAITASSPAAAVQPGSSLLATEAHPEQPATPQDGAAQNVLPQAGTHTAGRSKKKAEAKTNSAEQKPVHADTTDSK